MSELAWWVLIRFSLSFFFLSFCLPPSSLLPINSLGNNAGEHNESVVPIKCIDGQLGSGRLIDFALTSGRPAGPWHACRLMSPFTCKFKEIMRASPRKFTQKRRRHPQYGGGSSRRDGRSSKSSCTFLLGATRPEEFFFFFISMVRPQILWGFIHCGR